MLSYDDFKDSEGRTDWSALRKARVEAGEYCITCGGWILFPKGYQTECGECKTFETIKTEISNDRFVRCPWCLHRIDVYGDYIEGLMDEGTHDTCCPSCDKEFSVTTRITHSFESPALGTRGDEIE
jgi:hypothetical protein